MATRVEIRAEGDYRPGVFCVTRPVCYRGGFVAAVYTRLIRNPFWPNLQDGIHLEVVALAAEKETKKNRGVRCCRSVSWSAGWKKRRSHSDDG